MTATSLSRRPGRPANESLTPSILQAALDELAVAGFEALSLEQVARRAGTAKTSLYRRWPSKDALIADALRLFVSGTGLVEAAGVDHGTLRADLLAHARHLVRLLTPERVGVLSGLLLALRSRPAIAEIVRGTLLGAERDSMAAVLARAAGRDELDPSSVPPAATHVLASMVFMRLFVAGGPLSDGAIAEIVEVASHALGARRPSPRQTRSRRPVRAPH
jgi:AcrR family transcriptional regulator